MGIRDKRKKLEDSFAEACKAVDGELEKGMATLTCSGEKFKARYHSGFDRSATISSGLDVLDIDHVEDIKSEDEKMTIEGDEVEVEIEKGKEPLVK